MWLQKTIQLSPKGRGFHLVTDEILNQFPEIRSIKIGLAHLLLQHTSASLSINENADSSVRRDMESYYNELAPEGAAYYEHTCEGSDDMPAHLKSSLLGVSLTLPIQDGCFHLGAWQGLYLGEHRYDAGARIVIATLQGMDKGEG